MSIDLGDADGVLAFSAQRLVQGIERRRGHGWDRDEEREFQRRSPRHARDLSCCDGGHGARCSREYRRKNLAEADRKSTRLNSSHSQISYAVFCLKKKKQN